MEGPTNKERASWARLACIEFCRSTGQTWDAEPADVMVDLVANLMHLWHEDGGDADDMIRRAANHFAFECNEEACLEE